MQQALVVLIVGVAVLFAAWRLMGLAARLRVLDAVARAGLGPLSRHAQRKARGLREGSRAAGCAGCAAASAARKGPTGR